MPGKINGFSLAYTTAGGIVLWSGIRGWTISETFKNLLSGQTPSSQSEPVSAVQTDINTGTSIPGVTVGIPAGIASSESANQAIAQHLAQSYGWSSGIQWDDLVSLWNRESGWSNTADTRVSGLDPANASVFAYGIAQARPYSKMPKAAWPPDKGGKADPTAQITWGLSYIKSSYGSPASAWSHEQSAGWY